MATAIAWVRTWLFRLVFYAGSVPIVLSVPVSALFGQGAVIRNARVWSRFHGWATRVFLGITTRVEGRQEYGQVLYASKHQAMYETIELENMLDGPAVVIKRELTGIPAWGFAAMKYGAIPVDREASAKALRQLMRDAAAARATGRSVIVYPEGTRVPVGETPPLRSGFAGLYRALNLPVVPIALDSGRLMPKKGAKHAGVVTFRFGEPIPPGLPRAEAEARVHAAINALERAR